MYTYLYRKRDMYTYTDTNIYCISFYTHIYICIYEYIYIYMYICKCASICTIYTCVLIQENILRHFFRMTRHTMLTVYAAVLADSLERTLSLEACLPQRCIRLEPSQCGVGRSQLSRICEGTPIQCTHLCTPSLRRLALDTLGPRSSKLRTTIRPLRYSKAPLFSILLCSMIVMISPTILVHHSMIFKRQRPLAPTNLAITKMSSGL